MNNYYLAVDIGASSGRFILGHIGKGKLIIQEIHRFDNGYKALDGSLVWDTQYLFNEILTGLSKCKKIGKTPISMGIDTWGVDYVLLDKNYKKIGKSYSYRDNRTKGMDALLNDVITGEELYRRTGLQKLPFNTIYQLMAHKKYCPNDMKKAAYFLMLPDYFHFLLTGEITNEYTNASTTQLVDVRKKDWDKDLILKAGIDESLLSPLSMPGTLLGKLTKDIEQKIGFNCKVVLPATHDTGSAFMAVPAIGDNSIYISSGTWSLMGCELYEPITSLAGMKLNFTNEGGYNYRYRFLKNLMGLWMLKTARDELAEKPSFDELSRAAADTAFGVVIDCNDNRFLAPKSMIDEIKLCCMEQGFAVPETTAELSALIHNSLAACYKKTYDELTLITQKTYDSVNIVGGGAQNKHLNHLTAMALGLPVYQGPYEATAIGNIIAQMIGDGLFSGLEEARKCIRSSFEITPI